MGVCVCLDLCREPFQPARNHPGMCNIYGGRHSFISTTDCHRSSFSATCYLLCQMPYNLLSYLFFLFVVFLYFFEHDYNGQNVLLVLLFTNAKCINKRCPELFRVFVFLRTFSLFIFLLY